MRKWTWIPPIRHRSRANEAWSVQDRPRLNSEARLRRAWSLILARRDCSSCCIWAVRSSRGCFCIENEIILWHSYLQSTDTWSGGMRLWEGNRWVLFALFPFLFIIERKLHQRLFLTLIPSPSLQHLPVQNSCLQQHLLSLFLYKHHFPPNWEEANISSKEKKKKNNILNFDLTRFFLHSFLFSFVLI